MGDSLWAGSESRFARRALPSEMRSLFRFFSWKTATFYPSPVGKSTVVLYNILILNDLQIIDYFDKKYQNGLWNKKKLYFCALIWKGIFWRKNRKKWQRKTKKLVSRWFWNARSKRQAAYRECLDTLPPRTAKTPPKDWNSRNTTRIWRKSLFTKKSNNL